MTVESDLFALLSPLAGARVYPDVAPAGVARPCITYQQVGGESLAYIEAGVPNAKNGRFQVNCWGTTRLAVAALALQVETPCSPRRLFRPARWAGLPPCTKKTRRCSAPDKTSRFGPPDDMT